MNSLTKFKRATENSLSRNEKAARLKNERLCAVIPLRPRGKAARTVTTQSTADRITTMHRSCRLPPAALRGHAVTGLDVFGKFSESIEPREQIAAL
jgi:hypothetical protein